MVIICMGVSGAGKSTVGRLVAAALGAAFVEGDDYHPPANVEKMSRGEPLTDADRRPWLTALAAAIDEWLAAGRATVLTCSALKQAYRDILIGDRRDVWLVNLRGDRDLIARRLAARRGHFMPPSLLASQFAALEAPAPAAGVITVDIAATSAAIAAEVLRHLPPAERSPGLHPDTGAA